MALNILELMPEAGREEALALLQRRWHIRGLQPQVIHRRAKEGRALTVSTIAAELVDGAGEIYAITTTERIVAG